MATPSSVSLQRELPLFPLAEVVLFPNGMLPLHIFEKRYRQMVSSLLAGDRCFGVVRFDPDNKESALIGCATEIGKVIYLPDGRMNIMTKGLRRFRVLKHVLETPYIVGLVEWYEDDKPDRDLGGLREDAVRLLKEVVRLSSKLTDKTIELPANLPEEADELSFWIAGNFYGDSLEQQSLLELQETSVRLEREVECLLQTCKEMAARTAIKEALG
jgi:ATP-dependent Lon protease